MLILGIETSCDDTGLALVRSSDQGVKIVNAMLSSQARDHRQYGGVVPEIAVREHLRNLPIMISGFIKTSGLVWGEIDAIAVTRGPGLIASLLVGLNFARGLALALDRPLYGINHLVGHLYSGFLAVGKKPEFPFLGLVVSGGHTILVRADGDGDFKRIGGTIDDAAGECLDKIARLLGLGYPGGPEIEQRAKYGKRDQYHFPRSMDVVGNYDFSFSGLKTSLRYFLERRQEQINDPDFVADVCASLQEAVMEILVKKTIAVALDQGLKRISVGGGVACNKRLQHLLSEACQEHQLDLWLAPPWLCTDNAAMIASVGWMRACEGRPSELLSEADPSLGICEA
jgi:N6-L-threonylcarbamoyladenine synthase